MHISRWGDSLAVRLPEELVERLGVVEGDEVELTVAADRTIAVEKIDRRGQFLADLAKFNWPLPEGDRFDRDEANER